MSRRPEGGAAGRPDTDGTGAASSRQRSSALRFGSAHRVPLLVALAGLVATASVTTLSHLNYLHSEHRVLNLEGNLTVSSLAVGPVDLERRLGRVATAASLTQGSASLFGRDIATSVGASGPLATAELFELTPGGPELLASAGGTPVLSPTSTALKHLCRTAARVHMLAVTRLVHPGIQRFAYALAAAAPNGGPTYVAYGEQEFPATRRTAIPASSPDADLNVAIYFGKTTARPDLVESSVPPPLGGATITRLLPFGDRVLTIVISARGSLVGTLAAVVAWIALGLGLLFTAVAVGIAEWLGRRRRSAERVASVSRSLYRDQRLVAETLQRALLPSRLPQPEGFEVAARYRAGGDDVEVGGDWYDVVVVGDSLFFSIGDVSGHGLEAAALMAQLRHVITAHGFDGADPGAALGKASRIVALEPRGRFATVLCGRIRLSTGDVILANAGHITPVLATPGGTSVVDVPPDPPLGIGADYRTHALHLEPGDTLVAVTDGIVERRGELIDSGIERLRAGVDFSQALDDLLDNVLERLAPVGASDDIAMLAVRRTAEPAARGRSRAGLPVMPQ